MCQPGSKGGDELDNFFCLDDIGHRDVTTREVRDFVEFSKMALAMSLDAWATRARSLSWPLCWPDSESFILF